MVTLHNGLPCSSAQNLFWGQPAAPVDKLQLIRMKQSWQVRDHLVTYCWGNLLQSQTKTW